MKKALLSLGAAALVLSFASCTKDYTCTCTEPDLGSGAASTYVTVFEKTTRADAAAACPESQTVTSSGISVTYSTCDLEKD